MSGSNNNKPTQLGACAATSGCEIVSQTELLLFTKSQAARMLNLAESSIEWLLRKGTIPHHKIAGKIRFTRSDLQVLIDRSAVTQSCAAIQEGA